MRNRGNTENRENIIVSENVRILLKSSEPLRWLFYGDSITHGACHTFGKRDFSEIFREHIVWETGRKNDLVLNSAYSGFTCRELLRDFDFRAAAFRPHAAFVMIGSNDCVRYPKEEFDGNLEQLLKFFRGIGCRVILQTPPPVITPLDPERGKNLAIFRDVLLQFAAKEELDLIDHWELWNRLSPQDRYYLMSDPLHPNGEGHLKIAQDIFRFLNDFTQDTPMCRIQPGPRIFPEQKDA